MPEEYSKISTRSILAKLHEKRKEQIKKMLAKNPSISKKEEDIEKILSDIEATNKKYAIWIAKQIQQGSDKGGILLEDIEEQPRVDLQDLLKKYERAKHKLPDGPDINKYTKEQLSDALAQVAPEESKRQKIRELKEGVLILENPPYKVIKITDEPGAIHWGQDTGWCTKFPDYANSYLKDGPLYVVLKDNEKFAQIHFPTGQYMDVRDNYLSDAEMKKISPSLNKLLNTDPDLKHDAAVKYYAKTHQPKEFAERLRGIGTVDGDLDLSDFPDLDEIPEGLTIKGYLNVSDTNIKKLPNNLTVNEPVLSKNIEELPEKMTILNDLYLKDSSVKRIPPGVKIHGDLFFGGEIPEGFEIGGSLYVIGGPDIPRLPTGLRVGGDLALHTTNIEVIPSGWKIKGDLDLSETPVKKISPDLQVGGSLILHKADIETIPPIEIGGDLILSDSKKVKLLSPGLRIGGDLKIDGTNIKEVPEGVVVGGKIIK